MDQRDETSFHTILHTLKAVADKLHGVGESDKHTLAAVERERGQLVPQVPERPGRPGEG